MKVIKEKNANPLVALTVRLPKDLLEDMTDAAEQHDISRQRLIAEILGQALRDKNFELKIREE